MSKKKATMTLKDFHGGCIPSDLPLPSAPGVTRGAIDQPTSWGNSAGRSDPRLRPASAGSTRNLDEKAPFLSRNSHIGRNFDEDERKPFDGISSSRRTVGDERIRPKSGSLREPKIDNHSGSRLRIRPASVPTQTSSPDSSSYVGRVNEMLSVRSDNQTGDRGYRSNYPVTGGNPAHAVAGSYPNAWGVRKETAPTKVTASPAWSAPDAATKLAHASALEKVLSGRWSLKQQVPSVRDSELFGRPVAEGELVYSSNDSLSTELFERPVAEGELVYSSNDSLSKRTSDRLDVVTNSDSDIVLSVHAERNLVINDGIHGAEKERLVYEGAKPTVQVETYARKSSITGNGFQSRQPTGKSGGTGFLPTLPSKSPERPKLKLLPRSKPVESIDTMVVYKKGNEQISDYPLVEDNYVSQEPKNRVQSSFVGPAVVDRAPERPKLNLKPRTQPIEQLEGNDENRRRTVFGGARPREVVLKERGIDDDVSHLENHSSLRMKGGVPKMDTPMNVSAAHYPEKAQTIPSDQKIVKYTDRLDNHLDGEKTDPQRRSRLNEIRRNNRDIEKHHSQPQKQVQVQDRPPSPETWRKPVEPARQAPPDGPPLHYRKATSAVEIAQAFSKSASSLTVADRFSSRSSNQMPFSRLVGPPPRPQINGY